MAKERTATEIPALAGLTFDQLQACLALGATLEQITSLAEGGFGFEQIQQLAPSLAAAKAGGGGISAADLKSLMESQRKAIHPENTRHPGISAFSYPEGDVAHPKPPLRRDTIFLGMRQKVDDLTPTEVELFNRFETSRTARGGKWEARLRSIDGTETLIITCAGSQSMDGRASLPSCSMILRELLDGPEAADPNALAVRVQQLEAQIKAMVTAGAAA